MRILRETSGIDRPEWLEVRRLGIGGSDVAAICGLNPYSSAIDVFMDKTGMAEERPDNESMRQGRDLEDYVASRFCEATGKKVRRRNAILQHDEYDFIIANIDRDVIGEDAGLECKTTSVYNADAWANGKTPDHYELQCHHYMLVTGAKRWYLACLIFNKALEIRTIERDEDVINYLLETETRFWRDYVEQGIMPPPDGSDNATDALKVIYHDTKPDLIVELADMAANLARYDEIVELETMLGTEKEQIKQEIMLQMGEAEIAVCGPRKITWKLQAGRKTIDAELLKKEKPDIYLNYLKCGNPFRVLRMGGNKND